MVGAGLTSLLGLTQENAIDLLRSQVQGSQGWGGASGTLFDGLDSTLPFPVALIKAIVERLFGTTLPGVSDMTSALSEVSDWAGQLLDGTLLDDLFSGTTGAGWPKTFPYSFLRAPSKLGLFLRHLASWLQYDFTSTGFNPVVAATTFVENVLLPSGLLGALDPLTGRLLNSQAPQMVQDMIDQMVSIINQTATVNNPLQVWINAFQSFWSMGTGALSTATSAAAQAAANAAQLNVALGGINITDPMDYLVGATLSSYTAVYSGPGSGMYIPVGDGTLDWSSAGGVDRVAKFHHNTAMNTDNGEITVVLPRAVQAPLNGNESYFWVRCRVSADGLNDVSARIGYNTVLIGYMVGGNWIPIGFPVSCTTADGDTWILRFGITATRGYQLLRNPGTPPVLDVTESVPNSQLGPSNRHPGFGVTTGSRSFNSAQTLPASLTVLTAIDK
jgi:hypothetical protein